VTRVHLARHGETDWNRERRWQGHLDPPLNAVGREQARGLAESLAAVPIAAVYSSDLRRASETAEIVSGALKLPLHVDAALRELDVGAWAGHTLAELRARHPEPVARWEKSGQRGWTGGESHEQMAARVFAAIRSIAGAHEEDDVLVVSHGGPIRALKALAAGVDYPSDRRSVPRTENCEVFTIAVREDSIRGID
jgi:broad specificity phosphatase PhoE